MRRLARPPAVLRRCLTAALGLWLALGSLAPALAATWTVRPGERIQDAIDRAAAGDTVEVQRARYLERLAPMIGAGRSSARSPGTTPG